MQGVEAVEHVIWAVANNNDPPIPAAHVLGFQNSSQIDDYLLAHQETVLGSVVFNVERGRSGLTSIGFTVQTNSSIQWFKGTYQDPNLYMQIPLQVAVERELVRYLAGRPDLGWDVQLNEFPHPASQSPSVIGQVAPTFLFASIMFQFVLLVHDVVCEKESGVRRMMNTMGLRPLPFWASWTLFQGTLAVVEACLLVGLSYALKFELFLDNAFLLSFLLLVLVSLAMTAFGFFVASFMRKASAAVPAGFVLFVVAWIFLVIVAFGFPFSPKYSPVAGAFFSFMPWAMLGKGVQDLAWAAAGRMPGISWDERYSYCLSEVPSPHQVQQLAQGVKYWQTQCVLPLGQIYWVLAVQCAGYMLLAMYLDAVLPDGNGVKLGPLFLLQPSYWFPSKKRNLAPASQALAEPTEAEEGLLVDTDVLQETDKMRARCRRYVIFGKPGSGLDTLDSMQPAAVPPSAGGRGKNLGSPAATVCLEATSATVAAAGGARDTGSRTSGSSSGSGSGSPKAAAADGCSPPSPTDSSESHTASLLQPGREASHQQGGGRAQQAQQGARRYAVEMFGLRKVYQRGGGMLRRRPFVAVRGNWLGIHEGECFCLLGPNGAGKSTTIHCMTGVLPLTSGDALVYGESIASSVGMDCVRPLMGVCPQFDVLWDNLTGREHLHLFAAIKGLPSQGHAEEASSLLEEVKLLEAGNVRSGAYSGGMKRRLSVAIALLGDPKVVYLDEPTTGLDPISRRHLWDLIDKAKRQRAIVLTTHSMEEADILGDRIGIMARGRLRCIGNSLRLKSRFGSGYRISVQVQGGDPSPSFSSWAVGDNQPSLGGPAGSKGGLYSEGTTPVLQPSARSPRPSPAGIAAWHAASPAGQAGSAAGEIQQEGGEQAAWLASVGSAAKLSPLVAVQMDRVRAVFLDRLGVKPVDETYDYLHFLVPYENEDKLPMLFTYLKAHSWELGIADIQLRLTPLEEVFLTISRKAELEHAQAEGRYEMLRLAEENLAIKVPVGAELIQSPGGQLYHIKWTQDESGALRLQDYWKDPVSAALSSSSSEVSAEAVRKSSSGSAASSSNLAQED